MTQKYVLGIDLGTTNSCVALMREGNSKWEVLSDSNGQKLVPSVVLFTKDGIVAGATAKAQRHIHPESVVYDSKRLIGQTYQQASSLNNISKWPFLLEKEETRVDGIQIEKVKISVIVDGRIRSYFPEEVSAHILARLKKMSEEVIDGILAKVVISVPANFGTNQKETTRQAAMIAGFDEEVIHIMNEPTAAALAHCSNILDSKEMETAIIYDLGGGTFDVSCIHFHDGKATVLGTDGNPQLGGQDFDTSMMEEVETALKLLEPHLTLSPHQVQTLRKDCELAKIDLVDLPRVTVTVKNVRSNGNDFSYTFTREEFNQMNSSKFKRTIRVVEEVLESAKLSKDEVTNIVLVGGSTRILQIRELVQNYFGKPPAKGINPDEAVAVGAVLYANRISGMNSSEELDLFDIAPNNIGIMLYDNSLSVLIPKGTPTKAYSMQTNYSNVQDDQKRFNFKVYEGSHVLDATKNHLVGQFLVENLPKGKAGQVGVDVTLSMDSQGLLEAKAVVTSTGFTKEVKMKLLERPNDEELQRMRLRCQMESKGEWKDSDPIACPQNCVPVDPPCTLPDFKTNYKQVETPIGEVIDLSSDSEPDLTDNDGDNKLPSADEQTTSGTESTEEQMTTATESTDERIPENKNQCVDEDFNQEKVVDFDSSFLTNACSDNAQPESKKSRLLILVKRRGCKTRKRGYK